MVVVFSVVVTYTCTSLMPRADIANSIYNALHSKYSYDTSHAVLNTHMGV